MTNTPKDRLLTLRNKIDQQRNTIEALKREGHACPDAERQLQQLLREYQIGENSGVRLARPGH